MNEIATASAKKPISHHVKKVFRKSHDPLWQVQLAIIAILVLQGFTNHSFLPVNKWLIIIVESILLIGLVAATSEGYQKESRSRRNIVVSLVFIIAAINIFSLFFLVKSLLFGQSGLEGRGLLLSGLVIYITNVLVFSLLYWEIDGGGPDARVANRRRRDFLFTQMAHPQHSIANWLPGYIDYLFVSIMTVTFTSSGTSPITHRVKLLMVLQSLVSILTMALVLARAVSILQ